MPNCVMLKTQFNDGSNFKLLHTFIWDLGRISRFTRSETIELIFFSCWDCCKDEIILQASMCFLVLPLESNNTLKFISHKRHHLRETSCQEHPHRSNISICFLTLIFLILKQCSPIQILVVDQTNNSKLKVKINFRIKNFFFQKPSYFLRQFNFTQYQWVKKHQTQ